MESYPDAPIERAPLGGSPKSLNLASQNACRKIRPPGVGRSAYGVTLGPASRWAYFSAIQT